MIGVYLQITLRLLYIHLQSDTSFSYVFAYLDMKEQVKITGLNFQH